MLAFVTAAIPLASPLLTQRLIGTTSRHHSTLVLRCVVPILSPTSQPSSTLFDPLFELRRCFLFLNFIYVFVLSMILARNLLLLQPVSTGMSWEEHLFISYSVT